MASNRALGSLERGLHSSGLPKLIERVFGDQPTPPDIRNSIVESWDRCVSQALDPGRLEIPQGLDVDVDGLLHEAAAPVLRRLEEEFADEPVSIVLTDHDGQILDRRAGDRNLNRALDGIQLVPRASYNEQHAGTNGIGTAATYGRPYRVFGTEHYSEDLRRFACAGAPIRHPVTRRMLGILDLTSFAKDGNALLCALDREAARDIERRLRELTSASGQALFRAFRAASTRTRRPVLGMADDLLMTNQAAKRILSATDQETLLAVARSVPRAAQDWERTVELSHGPAAVRVTPVAHGSRAAGVLVRVEGVGSGRSVTSVTTEEPPPELAGRSVAWRRAWTQLSRELRSQHWVLLVGEPGVGKAALVEAAHRQRAGDGSLHIIDLEQSTPSVGATGVEAVRLALEDPATSRQDTMLLRHLEAFDSTEVTALGKLLTEHEDAAERPWLAVTVTSQTGKPSPELDPVLAHFDGLVEVPALRYRIEDLHDLVPATLRRVAGGEYRVAQDAMKLLLRQSWPGNVDELASVLESAAEGAWSRVLSGKDLPASCHATSSRVLTAMEAVERDTIVDALIQTGGNVTEAAKRVGISRATIYRRIQSFGIDIEAYRNADR